MFRFVKICKEVAIALPLLYVLTGCAFGLEFGDPSRVVLQFLGLLEEM